MTFTILISALDNVNTKYYSLSVGIKHQTNIGKKSTLKFNN